MSVDLGRLMGADGARRTADVIAVSGKSSVGRWVREGRLLRPLPGVLVDPARAEEWRTRAAAATLWTGGRLAGRSALYLSDLVTEPGPRVHAAVTPARHIAVPRPEWLRVHVTRALDGQTCHGLPVTAAVRSLVDAWGHAHAGTGRPQDIEVARGAVIGATRRRKVTVEQLEDEASRQVRLPGRAALLELTALISSGCQSEFEVWGLRHLLDVPGLPPVRQQYPLTTSIGVIHLDGAWEDAQLGVELDGAAYHRSPDDWADDRRRDSAALALDWATLRIDHRRGHRDPAGCRAEIAAAFHARAARIHRAVI